MLTVNGRFGAHISFHAAVPVQMVLADVEHAGDGGLKIRHTFQLKTGQLQHPHIGQGIVVHAVRQGVQQCRADVAGHGHLFAGTLNQLARQCSHCGLAVGACDSNHLGTVSQRDRWRQQEHRRDFIILGQHFVCGLH